MSSISLVGKNKVVSMDAEIEEQDETKKKIPFTLLFTFFLLYFSEGIVVHTSKKHMPVLYNLAANQSYYFLSVSLLAPYGLKLIFASLSDRFSIRNKGHRKPFILIGLGICLLGQIVAIGLPMVFPDLVLPNSAVIALSLLYLIGISILDAAADGWGIDVTTTEAQECRVQAFFVGGRSVGIAVVAVLLSPDAAIFEGLVPRWMVLTVVGAVMLLSIAAVILVKETPKPPISSPRLLWIVSTSISNVGFFVVTISGLIAAITMAGIDTVYSDFVSEEFKVSQKNTNIILAIQSAGTLIGATLGQFLVEKYTYARIYPMSVLTLLFGSLLPTFAYSEILTWIFPGFVGLGIGIFSACFFALSMGMCKKQAAATMFAIIMLGGAIGTAAGQYGADYLKTQFGYQNFFLTVSLIGMLQVPIIYILFFSDKGKRQVKSARAAKTKDGDVEMVSNGDGDSYEHDSEKDGVEAAAAADPNIDDEASKVFGGRRDSMEVVREVGAR